MKKSEFSIFNFCSGLYLSIGIDRHKNIVKYFLKEKKFSSEILVILISIISNKFNYSNKY